jgi:hypothetical protein
LKPNSNQIQGTLVAEAVLNKYSDITPARAAELITSIREAIRDKSESELIAELRRITSSYDDIKNQVAVLELIDRFWSTPPKLLRPLSILHRCSAGMTSDDEGLREENHVEDFGGLVPTATTEVFPRLDELERLAENIVKHMAGSPNEDKMFMLAYIHGSMVRIHPFADGNGRTARMFIFYALRCWNLPLFAIPKVRNDQGWKSAMDSAVDGEVGELKEQLLARLKAAQNGTNIRREAN